MFGRLTPLISAESFRCVNYLSDLSDLSEYCFHDYRRDKT